MIPDPQRDALLATLFTAFRKPIDDASLDLYGHALEALPPALLSAAVARAVRTRRFLPVVAELLEDAEACRIEISAQHPFVACVGCRDRRPGWIEVVDPNDVKREMRCDCWTRHQRMLASAGYLVRPVLPALPEASGDEW